MYVNLFFQKTKQKMFNKDRLLHCASKVIYVLLSLLKTFSHKFYFFNQQIILRTAFLDATSQSSLGIKTATRKFLEYYAMHIVI
jgi:hypothetical protein